jgi:hypothetical protein
LPAELYDVITKKTTEFMAFLTKAFLPPHPQTIIQKEEKEQITPHIRKKGAVCVGLNVTGGPIT